MWKHIFVDPSTYHDGVEKNAILLDDSYFVRPSTDGEVVFLRKNCTATLDKDQLTRNAARRLVKYLHEGRHTFECHGLESSVALMLNIRNGHRKKDFWDALHQELITALHELLDSNEPFDVHDLFLNAPYPDYLNKATIPEQVDKAKEYADLYNNKEYLVLVDSEVERVLREAEAVGERFYISELDEVLGQYVFIDETLGMTFVDREMLLATKCRDLMMRSVGNCTFFAASSFLEFVFDEACYLEDVYDDFGRGLALYRKNGLTDADFWHHLCVELLAQLTEQRQLQTSLQESNTHSS